MTLRGCFVPERAIALFLDVDGTLLEIAASPTAVRVPPSLRNTIALAAQREEGALALISGRTLESLDGLFSPTLYPASGQHGYIRRDGQGTLSRAPADASRLRSTREALQEWVDHRPGLLLEDKGIALAIHYRGAPALEPQVQEIMSDTVCSLKPHFQLKPGKCVWELLPACCSKRTAIEAFMREPPFMGRTPVFVGDDVTDEDGFEAVNSLGGYSVRVGMRGDSAANHRFASVAGVIAWLRERNTRILRSKLHLPRFGALRHSREAAE